MGKYTIGTRGSKLALAQAETVRRTLASAYPEHEFKLLTITTKGDRITDRPLQDIGGKGLFVREIEKNILNGRVDIGVHSMKDMPSITSEGLTFTKPWKREDPRDVLILREKGCLESLPCGAVIGTGSKRRNFQLMKLRPDLNIVNIRGNVDTRLRKMDEQKLDGIVLAAAGLHRLGIHGRVTQYLEPEQMIPAPAQGVLAIEIRRGENYLRNLLDAQSDEETAQEVTAERGFLEIIGGDCRDPVGAICRKQNNGSYRLDTMFANYDGTQIAFSSVCGTDPIKIASEAATDIKRKINS